VNARPIEAVLHVAGEGRERWIRDTLLAHGLPIDATDPAARKMLQSCVELVEDRLDCTVTLWIDGNPKSMLALVRDGHCIRQEITNF
jgi:hypothetical protein